MPEVTFTQEQIGVGLVALGLVCMTRKVYPDAAVSKEFRKQFMDYATAHGLTKADATSLFNHLRVSILEEGI